MPSDSFLMLDTSRNVWATFIHFHMKKEKHFTVSHLEASSLAALPLGNEFEPDVDCM
jgi:hypothetical protein